MQRTLAAPEVIARGLGLYGVYCRACHGADLRGGDQGGPNLLRSQVALSDQNGELIGEVITKGRQNPGMTVMPPLPLPQADIEALAAYIHSVHASARGQGSPPASATPIVLNVVVGNARAGQAYFAAKCAKCHSATGDLAGIGTRVTDPMQLQNGWVAGTAGGGRGGRGGGAAARPTTVTVTLASGQKFEGPLVRIDDFIVVMSNADGTTRSFRRSGGTPAVVVNNPRQPHLDLLPTYTDKDMHDVTAYLVTLK